MQLYNLKDKTETVSFCQAVKQGLGSQQGLFFPEQLPEFSPTEIAELLAQDFITRSSNILSAFIGDEIHPADVYTWVKNAFTFPAPVQKITDDISVLELFHGPTLAFKDFGARFMAQVLSHIAAQQKITILTATSGDTGAAVAHAFYKLPNINVVILYPNGKISPLQEKMFCTLGDNVKTIAIDGNFDDCQDLVKQAFDDHELAGIIGLNSANSINISRLLAQICYYFEAYNQLSAKEQQALVISVPSGNFGNLTAGLLAKAIGLPIKRFIAATNTNATVPNYLATGLWEPHAMIPTLSNAMDVSNPNNWPRIENLFANNIIAKQDLGYGSVDDKTTIETIKELDQKGYLSEPHAAVAYRLLADQLQADEYGLFLGTAHPAKFNTVVEDILTQEISLPPELEKHVNLRLLSTYMDNDFSQLRTFLLTE